MKNTFTKKIEKNNKKIVKNVSKTMKKNPNATVAIAATAGTGFLGLGVLNIVSHMRNRKLVKAAKAMDEAQASSTNANDAQHTPEQEPQEEPTTTETSTTTSANTANTTATNNEQSSPVSSINPEILQTAFNEFNCVRNDPRSQGWTDEQIASTVAQRFASEPNGIGYIYAYILNLVARINYQNLQAAVMRQNNATQPHEPEAFDEPETNDETNDTNPDEGKYPAASKKQQKNGNKGNNKK